MAAGEAGGRGGIGSAAGLRALKYGRELLDASDHRTNLGFAEQILEGRHRARLQAVRDHTFQIGVGWRLARRCGLVFEESEREIARSGNQRRRGRSVSAAVRTMADGAALHINPRPEGCTRRDVGAGRPAEIRIRRGRRLPDFDGMRIADARVDRSCGVEDRKERDGNDYSAPSGHLHTPMPTALGPHHGPMMLSDRDEPLPLPHASLGPGIPDPQLDPIVSITSEIEPQIVFLVLPLDRTSCRLIGRRAGLRRA